MHPTSYANLKVKRQRIAEEKKLAGTWGKKPSNNQTRTDGLRMCSMCREDKPSGEFYKSRNSEMEWFSSYCKACAKIRAEERRKANPDRKRAYDLKGRCKKFGTTANWFHETLASQDGKCAICDQPETHPMKRGMDKIRQLAIDHDHETGKPRGLLCFRCNTSVHLLDKHGRKWAEKALKYLNL